jgi:hypothetical protein
LIIDFPIFTDPTIECQLEKKVELLVHGGAVRRVKRCRVKHTVVQSDKKRRCRVAGSISQLPVSGPVHI